MYSSPFLLVFLETDVSVLLISGKRTDGLSRLNFELFISTARIRSREILSKTNFLGNQIQLHFVYLNWTNRIHLSEYLVIEIVRLQFSPDAQSSKMSLLMYSMLTLIQNYRLPAHCFTGTNPWRCLLIKETFRVSELVNGKCLFSKIDRGQINIDNQFYSNKNTDEESRTWWHVSTKCDHSETYVWYSVTPNSLKAIKISKRKLILSARINFKVLCLTSGCS